MKMLVKPAPYVKHQSGLGEHTSCTGSLKSLNGWLGGGEVARGIIHLEQEI